MNPEPMRWEVVKVSKPKGLIENFIDRSPDVLRALVPNGWLVYAHGGDKAGLAFIPDPQHVWQVELED